MFPDFSPIVAFFAMSVFLLMLGCCLRAALLKSQRRELSSRTIHTMTSTPPPPYLRQTSANHITSVWIVPATNQQLPTATYAPVHGHRPNNSNINDLPPPYVLPPSYDSVVTKARPSANENVR